MLRATYSGAAGHGRRSTSGHGLKSVQHDHVIQAKAGISTCPFFTVRIALYFAIWICAGLVAHRGGHSSRTGPAIRRSVRMRQFSAPGLWCSCYRATFAFFDLIMSLEPQWFSTIYGAMFLIGQMLATLAFMIAVVIVLANYPPFSEIMTIQHFHDLGNLMFAFTMLWAYLSFSQFLIIWAGNRPKRFPGIYGGFGRMGRTSRSRSLSFHFRCTVCDSAVSVSRNGTRSCFRRWHLWMIFARMLDVFWVGGAGVSITDRMPLHRQVFMVSWTGFGRTAGHWRNLDRGLLLEFEGHPLLPFKDPRLTQYRSEWWRRCTDGDHHTNGAGYEVEDASIREVIIAGAGIAVSARSLCRTDVVSLQRPQTQRGGGQTINPLANPYQLPPEPRLASSTVCRTRESPAT